jgi:hypothetical protein
MSGALMTQTKVAVYPGKSCDKIRTYTARKYMPFCTDPESGRPMCPKAAIDAWVAAFAEPGASSHLALCDSAKDAV